MKTIASPIEPLETRIAPAAILNYTDVDGDKVTLTSSVGTNAALAAAAHFDGSGHQLQLLDLSAGTFAGANLTFTVVKVVGGDGLANIGYINSTGHDLGAVTVKGDLGQIDAGSNSATIPAIKSLSVRSMGRLGTDTQAAASPSLESDINGALGSLVVTGDVKEAYIKVFGGTTATIGPLTIGGSLIGGSTMDSGEIDSGGSMGAVKIGHDVQGGSGFVSGAILCAGKLTSLTIGGSLLGGRNSFSGAIESGDTGAVKVGGDVQGGSGPDSGLITLTTATSVTIGGSILGGSGNSSGELVSSGNMGAVKIGHDLTGGSIFTTNSLTNSGVVESQSGRIASVAIGGSVISGFDVSSGSLTFNATIRAGNDIGSLTVAGSLIGHGNTGTGASPVIISARGQAVQGATTDLAIGKISIGGHVEFAQILAGYNDTTLAAVNADAQIGAVKVTGDWVASDLVAGAMNSGYPKFGDANDAKATGGTDTLGILSKIASITIAGQVFGTPVSTDPNDQYGFVAEQIGAVKIGGNTIALAATNNPQPVGETADVDIHIVP